MVAITEASAAAALVGWDPAIPPAGFDKANPPPLLQLAVGIKQGSAEEAQMDAREVLDFNRRTASSVLNGTEEVPCVLWMQQLCTPMMIMRAALQTGGVVTDDRWQRLVMSTKKAHKPMVCQGDSAAFMLLCATLHELVSNVVVPHVAFQSDHPIIRSSSPQKCVGVRYEIWCLTTCVGLLLFVCNCDKSQRTTTIMGPRSIHMAAASAQGTPSRACLSPQPVVCTGPRRRLEDTCTLLPALHPTTAYLGVFDGHAGSTAAVYAARHLHTFIHIDRLQDETTVATALRDAFVATDREVLATGTRAGTTALVLLLQGCVGTIRTIISRYTFVCSTTLYVAHVGDSRAVLCTRRGPVALTHDHAPDVQRERTRCVDHNTRVSLFYTNPTGWRRGAAWWRTAAW